MPAIRSRSRGATTSRARTSSRSSTSAPASRRAALLYDMIERVADQVFIPLTVGGGVSSIDDIRALLNAGADKVSINTAAVTTPELIERSRGALRLAVHRRRDRRQAVRRRPVAGRDPRRPHADGHRRRRSGRREVCARGAGEILLTSMDRDGARSGFDLKLTRAVVDAVDVPVIASGGVGSLAHLVEGHRRRRRRRGAGRVDLPLRRAHDRRRRRR